MITIQAGTVGADLPFVLWSNVLDAMTLTATSAAAGGPVENITGPQTYDFWTPAALPAAVTGTKSAGVAAVDCVALAAHNLGSKGASVALEYAATAGGAWVSLADVTPTDDTPLAILFPEVAAAKLRLSITGTAAPSIGVMFAGKRLILPSPVMAPYVPAARAARVKAMPAMNAAGHYLGGRVQRLGADITADLTPVSRAWAESDLPGFAGHYDNGGAFFWAASPQVLPADLAFAWRAEGAAELRPTLRAGGALVDLHLEMGAYAG